ncbi:MAG: Smr/MutS family protein [Polyangiaceae bacterium]
MEPTSRAAHEHDLPTDGRTAAEILCPPKTRTDLEWQRVLDAVAARCEGPMGKALARALPFPETREDSLRALEESREARMAWDDGDPLPVRGVPDVQESVERARAQGVLSATELRSIGEMLGVARGLRRFLSSRRERMPALFELGSTDPTLDDLERELVESFDADGALSDRASPRLAALRGEWRASRARVISRLEDLMSKYDTVIQDRFVTEREGRYVLPVRSDAHDRFQGIVHGSSQSGATLFIEPRVIVPMGNRLKMLEADVTREEHAVFARLSGLVQEALVGVEHAIVAVAWLDVRAAIAKLAADIRLVFPDTTSEPVVNLRKARHPLLALDLPVVVPSDLSVKAGQAVIVSGPNAGGKTVALKALGLAALMVRAGMPVAAGDGSVVGLFDAVLTDVGDEQNLQKNLSTFSAHVSNVVRILDDTHRGALVLMDELATGTDPREGEALAAGVLDSLSARGGATVVTTHYEGLKALALADPRFTNASVGFDREKMLPTFQLSMGVPGGSSALLVARRFGMPPTVLERAERFLTREEHDFEETVKKLHDERAATELARRAAETREAEARAKIEELDREIDRARDREEAKLTREAEALVARLRRAKEELREAEARLRNKKAGGDDVREAARALERVASEVAVGGALEPLVVAKDDVERVAVEPHALKRGARVYGSRIRAEAEVLAVLPDGSVRVAAGALKLVVDAKDLLRSGDTKDDTTPGDRAKKHDAKGPRASAPRLRVHHRPERGEATAAVIPEIPTRENSVDLRGMRTDDALSMAATFLDRCISSNQGIAFLIHGHGTGALREAIRKELSENRYVSHFRPGVQSEGGDGVTVVRLA